METATAATLVFDIDDWPGHRAGQHVDARLTAEDGYQAQRSYSLASAPEDGRVQLTVEMIEDGEVSPYLVEDMEPGDELELRGPIGGWFVWDAAAGGPLLLVAGGSGVVPLRSMLRHRAAAGAHDVPARLLLSARAPQDVIYAAELAAPQDGYELVQTFTRSAPEGWTGPRRRVDREMLAGVAWPPADEPRIFVCGPTAFVETVAGALVELGHDGARIKTERFGPTG
jgi:ferredoxin-NADP reductase